MEGIVGLGFFSKRVSPHCRVPRGSVDPSSGLAFPLHSGLGEPSALLPCLPKVSFPAKCSISSGQTCSCGAKGHALNCCRCSRSQTQRSPGVLRARGDLPPQESPKKPLGLPDAIPADAWQSLAGLFCASSSDVLHAAGGGDFCLCVCFFFSSISPEVESRACWEMRC